MFKPTKKLVRIPPRMPTTTKQELLKLVDREEGGSDRIKSLGYEVVHSFTKSELIERKSGETAATCPVA